MGARLRNSRYGNAGWEILDALTCIFMIPFEHVVSLTISVFIFTCHDNDSIIHRIIRYFFFGPLMILFSLLLLPFGVVGYIVWMLINALADVQPFMFTCPEKSDLPQAERGIFSGKITICSGNLCIVPEYIGRINNQRNVYWRFNNIRQRLLYQDSSLNKPNMTPPVSRENVILTELPDVDVFTMQEVFDRLFNYQLCRTLREKYPYCIYDVGYHTLLGNHGGLGSGLFMASRHPILEAQFHPFSSSCGYGAFVNMGVLVAKLDLGVMMKDGKQLQAVGYHANMHAQAFQGPYQIIKKQLQEAESSIEKFIADTRDEDDVIVYTVFGGDLNCDNLSPGDAPTQNLSLWNRFRDPCRESSGEDKPWTIGTEHREKNMNHPIIHDRHVFRKALLDDVQRRHFILDADVEEQTLELMTCSPTPDANGNVTATKFGGRRRIDYLTCHEKSLVIPTGFWFSTVLAGLTDHIPVVLMLESPKDHHD